MPLMFAYGANMDVAEMGKRAPASKVVGVARLPRHRFVITEDGYAGVVHSAKHAVYGLLWDIALADMRALDQFEGIARGLYRKSSQMVITSSGAKRALIYLASGKPGGQPKPGYLAPILAAAEALGLPEAYRVEIAMCGKGGVVIPEAIQPTRKPAQKPPLKLHPPLAVPRASRDRQGS